MKKRKFRVYARTPQVMQNGVRTGKGHRQFKGKTAFYVNDPSEAAEIEQVYGKSGSQDVMVAEDEQYARALNGEKWAVQSDLKGTSVKVLHSYHFTMPIALKTHTHPKDDPAWEYIGAGRWRHKPKEKRASGATTRR